MEFRELDIGDTFEWQNTEWEKHKPAHAKINSSYPRGRNNEVYFPPQREVNPIS